MLKHLMVVTVYFITSNKSHNVIKKKKGNHEPKIKGAQGIFVVAEEEIVKRN